MLRNNKYLFNSNPKRLVLKSVLLTLFSILSLSSIGLVSANEAASVNSATEKLHLAKQEFYQEKAKNPVFRREFYDINYNIRAHQSFAKNRRTLSANEAWQGVMEKAWNPVKYIPHAIKKGLVLKETVLEDNKASFFVRISVQVPFIENKEKKNEFTVVREEIAIDKINKIVYFMGRIPTPSDYQLLNVDPKEAKPQVLFLDEHKVVTIDNEPLDSWTLVTLPTKGFNLKDQEFFVKNLFDDPGKPDRIYQQTQKLF